MFSSDITLNTKAFSLAAQRTQSSLRRVSTRPVSAPLELNIAHETAKSGRVSTAVYIDDVAVVQVGSSAAVKDTVRVLVKLQYNPMSGRTTTNADIKSAVADIVSFLSTANIDKLLNQES